MCTLYGDIQLEDFQTAGVPKSRQTSSPKASKTSCRDGFNDMETVPTGRGSSSKKRKKDIGIIGMGQLPLAEGTKEVLHRKARVCRPMPILDPDLLPPSARIQPTAGSTEMQKGSASKTTHEDSNQSYTMNGFSIREPDDNGDSEFSWPFVAASPKVPVQTTRRSPDLGLAPMFARRIPSTSRQPLAFGRRLSEDLMMVKATRTENDTNKDSDGGSEVMTEPASDVCRTSDNMDPCNEQDEDEYDENNGAADQKIIRESLAVLTELTYLNHSSSLSSLVDGQTLLDNLRPFGTSESCPTTVMTRQETLEDIMMPTEGLRPRPLSFHDKG